MFTSSSPPDAPAVPGLPPEGGSYGRGEGGSCGRGEGGSYGRGEGGSCGTAEAPALHPLSDLEHVNCAVCGSAEADTVYEAQYDREKDADLVQRFRATGDELLIDRLVRCRSCGLQYVSPRLAAPLILESYAEGDDPTYVAQMSARQRTFDRALDRIERLAPAKGRLLDVGTAAGAFLAVARRRGWEVYGCEPNRWLAAWGSRRYGLNIRSGDLFQQPFEPRSFDAITLWDVIEHTPDPGRVVRRCAELLKPGGLLIVNYPDIGSVVARTMGRKWLFLTSVHLHYFTPHTIRRLLEGSGFAIAEVRPHIQRLQLAYILSRTSVLSERFARTAGRIVNALGIGRLQVPYWLGQTFVAARRKIIALITGIPGFAFDWVEIWCSFGV